MRSSFGSFCAGRTWACSFFFACPSPPWQPVQEISYHGCISSMRAWHATQASARDVVRGAERSPPSPGARCAVASASQRQSTAASAPASRTAVSGEEAREELAARERRLDPEELADGRADVDRLALVFDRLAGHLEIGAGRDAGDPLQLGGAVAVVEAVPLVQVAVAAELGQDEDRGRLLQLRV